MQNESGESVIYHPDYRIITDTDYNHLEDPESGSIVTDLQRAFRDRTNTTIERPQIIQGGMGVGVSGWKLARAAAMSGKNGDTIGTLSGTGIEWVVAYYLKLGGQDALEIQDALKDFPDPEMADRVLKRYSPGSKTSVQVFKATHPRPLKELMVCATYAAIKLARKGHNNPISINLLDKVGMPHPYSILGAMLAGVDIITMGAGLPHQIPEIINAFLEGRKATFRNPVTGGGFIDISLDSKEFFGKIILPTKRPKFFPIEGSPLAIWALMKKIPKNIREDSVDGVVVEGKKAGGHNAPEKAERPGRSNSFSYEEIAAFGRPFWIADGDITLKNAQELGGVGLQRGSGYALCEDSGMLKPYRDTIKKRARSGRLKVRTDEDASPTGFPFKVAEILGTVSEAKVYREAERACTRGLLVEWYTNPDGTKGSRCPAEPEDDYKEKGGDPSRIEGAQCLCRRLNAAIGVGEGPAILTIGTQLKFLKKLPKDYSAAQYTELLRNE